MRITKLNFPKTIYQFGILSVMFLFFELVYIHTGFFLKNTITQYTLIIIYSIFICLTLIISKFRNRSMLLSLILFILVSISILFIGEHYFSKIYDTTWDGQGYHSSGIINLENHWNPLYEKDLPIKLPDATNLVQGYPKGLWEIQASFYALTGNLDSAKVINVIPAFIAFSLLFYLFRLLKINNIYSSILSILLIMQSVFIMQATTFMEDGFSYLMILSTLTLLIIFYVETSGSSLLGFFASLYMLPVIKYNNLPICVFFFLIFIIIFLGKLISKKLIVSLNFRNKIVLVCLIIVSSLFFSVPYLSNLINYNYPFYPTNNIDVMTAPLKNIPNNLKTTNRFVLFFYGIFSESQIYSAGNDKSRYNVATLKIPLTFTTDELENSVLMFGNRVGGGGPLYSGIFLFSIILFILNYKLLDKGKKKIYYTGVFIYAMLLVSILVSQLPNLFRYNSQLLILPFIPIVLTLLTCNKKIMKIFASILILLCIANSTLFTYFSYKYVHQSITIINRELYLMKKSKAVYQISIHNFYSNNIRLKNNNINYIVVGKLRCNKATYLAFSSYTTSYCELK